MNLVESVARKTDARLFEQPTHMDWSEEKIQQMRELVLSRAQTTILSTLAYLRENVTPEMVGAGWGELKRTKIPKLGPGPGVPEAFRAMIDVAIKEVEG